MKSNTERIIEGRWVQPSMWPRRERVGDRIRAVTDIFNENDDAETVLDAPRGVIGIIREVYRGHFPWAEWPDGRRTEVTPYETEAVDWER